MKPPPIIPIPELQAFEDIQRLNHIPGWHRVYRIPYINSIHDPQPQLVTAHPKQQDSTLQPSSSIHPGRLTWNLQITLCERKMIFQTSMIMLHVNLPGCKHTLPWWKSRLLNLHHFHLMGWKFPLENSHGNHKINPRILRVDLRDPTMDQLTMDLNGMILQGLYTPGKLTCLNPQEVGGGWFSWCSFEKTVDFQVPAVRFQGRRVILEKATNTRNWKFDGSN